MGINIHWMLYENSMMAINLYKASQKNKVEKLINPISNCLSRELNYIKKIIFLMDHRRFSLQLWNCQRLYVQLGKSFIKKNFSSVVVISNMYGPDDHFDIEGHTH